MLGLARPQRHVTRWRIGPWAPAMTWFRQRPALTRVLPAAELAAGGRYAGRLPARPACRADLDSRRSPAGTRRTQPGRRPTLPVSLRSSAPG